MEICKPNSEMSMEEVVIGTPRRCENQCQERSTRICKENG